MIQIPMTDPILDEIHQTRREMSDRFQGDLVAMLDEAQRRQAAGGRRVWRSNRRIRATRALLRH